MFDEGESSKSEALVGQLIGLFIRFAVYEVERIDCGPLSILIFVHYCFTYNVSKIENNIIHITQAINNSINQSFYNYPQICNLVFKTHVRMFQHHCRACGQVFCSQCSSRNCTLPKFGIEKEVRVCEACYNKVNKFV